MGFCIDCNEHMCRKCYDCHCLPKPMRHHVLQNETDMPRFKPQTTDIFSAITATDICQHHPGEVVKFLCRSHDQLGSSMCVARQHRKCDNVSYIEDEFQIFGEEVNDLVKELENINDIRDKNLSDTERIHKEAIKEITSFVEEINMIVKTLKISIREVPHFF